METMRICRADFIMQQTNVSFKVVRRCFIDPEGALIILSAAWNSKQRTRAATTAQLQTVNDRVAKDRDMERQQQQDEQKQRPTSASDFVVA